MADALAVRRTVVVLTTVFAGAAVLVAVFAVIRGWPSLPNCITTLSRQQRAVVDDFRSAAVPIHLTVAAASLLAVVRLSSARRGPAAAHPTTLFAASLYAALLLVTIVNPDALAVAGVLQSWFRFIIVPLVVLVFVATVGFLARERTRRRAPSLALAVGCGALLLLLPAHFAAVWLIDEPLCMS